MAANIKHIGYMLIVFSIVMLFVLSFAKVKIDQEGKFLCEVVSADPSFDMEQCPAHENNLSWLVLVAFGISLLVLAVGLYLSILFKAAEKAEVKDVDVSKLDDAEKIVYEIIKKEGSVYQSDLIKETGYSKVRTTRILDKLESRNIIERKRRGMTNIIVLK